MTMEDIVIQGRTRAIVCFGPMTDTTGVKPGTFFQVTIDPNMASPGGDYIRFDQRSGYDEIHGWQRIAGLTICEILNEEEALPDVPPITMRAVVKE